MRRSNSRLLHKVVMLHLLASGFVLPRAICQMCIDDSIGMVYIPINPRLCDSRFLKTSYGAETSRSCITNNLLQSRNLLNVQTLEYDHVSVCCTDLDPTGNFLLIGLSNGSVDVQGILDLNYGTLDHISRLSLSLFNLHRVQWNPGSELFFSMLDNHNLYLVDPNEMRAIERFNFNIKSTWSEWNPNDRKIIAICGTQSQARLVDIRSGSSAQSIILGAKSGHSSHRATRCLWSKQDSHCIILGDNEGYLHIYDTRQTTRPLLCAGNEEFGQISGMSFTRDQTSIITSQGTENHLSQWVYDCCSLRSLSGKFIEKDNLVTNKSDDSSQVCRKRVARGRASSNLSKNAIEKVSRKSQPVDAYIRCQFYVTDRHIFCPVPLKEKKSAEIYIYDLSNGFMLKALKPYALYCDDVYSVTGLLPESLVLYAGGRGHLKTWTLDENYQKKMEDKMKEFHKTNWGPDDED